MPADLTIAIKGLGTSTIRFAGFQLAGVESTADLATRTVWLNLKFSESNLPVEQVAPVLVHEGWHLAHPGDAVTAALIHGLASEWPVDRMASFANQLGAFVAGSPGAIPGWEQS